MNREKSLWNKTLTNFSFDGTNCSRSHFLAISSTFLYVVNDIEMYSILSETASRGVRLYQIFNTSLVTSLLVHVLIHLIQEKKCTT